MQRPTKCEAKTVPREWLEGKVHEVTAHIIRRRRRRRLIVAVVTSITAPDHTHKRESKKRVEGE